ncbi:TniQ family protein [Pseudomonas sp. RSB 5.4]|uniref:TniQ family protein n=1 Tax=Pseudomonas sp. RSB 5.4 TaxID=3127459 RepID=UPI0030CCD8D9
MPVCSRLISPIYDETLSSWLARLVLGSFVDRAAIQAHIKAHLLGMSGDIDALVENESFTQQFDAFFNVSSASVFRLPERPLLMFDSSTVYCPECLCDDVATNHAPAWRRSWRVQGAAVCFLHESPVLLRRVQETRLNYVNKAWVAFEEYIGSPAMRLQVNFALSRLSSHVALAENRFLLRLIARSQQWLNVQVRCGNIPELSFSSARFLMYLWLWRDASGEVVSGFASQYFRPLSRQRYTNSLSQVLGIDALFDEAEPIHLCVAYWLLGIAYGVISKHEAELIRAMTRSTTWFFPVDRAEIAECGRVALGNEAVKVARKEASEQLSAVELEQIAWAIGSPN